MDIYLPIAGMAVNPLFMVALGALVGILVGIVFGAPEPMSVSALLVALFTQLAIAVVTVVFLVMLARIYTQLSARKVSVPDTKV